MIDLSLVTMIILIAMHGTQIAPEYQLITLIYFPLDHVNSKNLSDTLKQKPQSSCSEYVRTRRLFPYYGSLILLIYWRS